MKTLFGVGLFAINSTELTNPSPLPTIISPFHHFRRLSRKTQRIQVFRSSLPGSELAGEDILQIFLKERQLNGDFISKASDILWRRDDLKFVDSETGTEDENLNLQKFVVVEDENAGGFLKLTKTHEWVSGGNIAPINKRSVAKNWEDDSEKRKRLSLLNYDALKREFLLLTIGIGAACTAYCWVTLSVQAAVSYAAGVLLSCLYLQLLYHYADNLSKEAVPQIFMQKKSKKKIGIRSEDLENLLERTVKGSTVALSSPRLVIPAVIYGFWGLSHHFFNNIFDFQIVPAMFGLFAYKAAALVQVYRDNEDLRLVFPDNDDDPNY
ncbi:NF-kappa-B inhibitor-like protein [Tasmannia lanceolata]|uniref:NF-kappa-B inhibitor-like protein n=1 Tax=Tasmannia lanceolata TaxID=3420 RepID=UPI004063601E